jgi:Leucine Rich repeat
MTVFVSLQMLWMEIRPFEILNIMDNHISSSGLDDITRILESTRIQKIDLQHYRGLFNVEASTQHFARVLSRHEFLKDLNLCRCQFGDGGIHIIANALDGNTIMEVLNIRWNEITSVGLADIARLIESTCLKKINLLNHALFSDGNANQQFIAKLLKNAMVQELLGDPAAGELHDTTSNVCARHKCFNHVNLLLAPLLPDHHQQQQNYETTTMMLKTCHRAIAKFAMNGPRGINSGASAIYKLFQARPQLLEKRLRRSSAAVAATTTAVSQEQKRQRL